MITDYINVTTYRLEWVRYDEGHTPSLLLANLEGGMFGENFDHEAGMSVPDKKVQFATDGAFYTELDGKEYYSTEGTKRVALYDNNLSDSLPEAMDSGAVTFIDVPWTLSRKDIMRIAGVTAGNVLGTNWPLNDTINVVTIPKNLLEEWPDRYEVRS